MARATPRSALLAGAWAASRDQKSRAGPAAALAALAASGSKGV